MNILKTNIDCVLSEARVAGAEKIEAQNDWMKLTLQVRSREGAAGYLGEAELVVDGVSVWRRQVIANASRAQVWTGLQTLAQERVTAEVKARELHNELELANEQRFRHACDLSRAAGVSCAVDEVENG